MPSGPTTSAGASGVREADRGLEPEIRASDDDQGLSDVDQSHASADRAASDGEETVSYSGRRRTDPEQRACGLNHPPADRSGAGTVSPFSPLPSGASRAARRGTAADRALDRTRQGTRRDEAARLSDLTASSRDLAADERDRAEARRAEIMLSSDTSDDPAIRALVTTSGGVRSLAAADRAVAASDRERASADRRQAAADRRQAHADLQRAHFASLTGVYMRDFGRVTLQEAIDRSRRSAEPFVLAFIDVDGLKALNDSEGHAAGDALLQTVGGVLKSKLRRNDPIARVGGDEFLCGLTNTELEVSQLRFKEIRVAVEQAAATGSITVGLASLGAGDTLEDLTARADIDMYARKPQGTRGNNH